MAGSAARSAAISAKRWAGGLARSPPLDAGAVEASGLSTRWRSAAAKAPKMERAAPAAKTDTAAVIAMPSRAKEKPVRDRFTMPRTDDALISQLKERGLGFKREVRKGELLRAGLQMLAAMDDAAL